MTPIAHFGTWKLASWVVGAVSAAVFTYIEKGTSSTLEIVVVAVTIAAVPPTVTGIFGLLHDRRMEKKLDQVGEKVDGILSKAHSGELAATTRADTAEAFTKGSDSERERGK